MEIFISVSAAKSVRKKSKTLAKKPKTTKRASKGKAKKKITSFDRKSRKAQILYLKRHPKTKYTMDDVKPKSEGDKEEALKKKKKPSNKEELPKDKAKEEPEEEETLDEKEATEEEESEDDAETEEDVDGEESDEEEDDTDADEAASKIKGKLGVARKRANSIADKTARETDDDELESVLDDIEDTKAGNKVDPEKRMKTLKFIGKLALGALIVAGGAVLASQMGPVGILLAKEFVSQLQWDSHSTSSDRHKFAVRDLAKSVIEFMENMDEEELACYIKRAKNKNKS